MSLRCWGWEWKKLGDSVVVVAGFAPASGCTMGCPFAGLAGAAVDLVVWL
jgi:hypothetical protein